MKTNDPAKSRSGCYWALLTLLIIGFVSSMALNVGLLLRKTMRGGEPRLTHSGSRPEDQFPQFNMQWSYGHGSTWVVRIPLQGVIMREPEGGLFTARLDRVQLTLNRIRAASNDERVRAIILEVDSPGGAVTPSDEIYHALAAFRASAADRRVVVFSRDMVASGAYYAAMASDWIVAEPTAIVGSIGVMIQTLNWKDLSERIGIHDTTIKSGVSKDMLNPFRTVSEEELGVLQDLVDSMFERFVGVVQRGRGLDDFALSRLTDGRVFTAEDALTERLIDEVGYWDDAVARVAALLGVDDVRVIRYERRTEWADFFASMRSSHPLMSSTWWDVDRPRVWYLWRP